MLRHAVIGALCCAATIVPTMAQSPVLPSYRIATPPGPARLIPFRDQLHVLCGRVDVDYNEIQDEGDGPPHWAVVDLSARSVVAADTLPWTTSAIHHPGVHIAGTDGTVWLADGGNLQRYDMVSRTTADAVATLPAYALGVSHDNAVVYGSLRPSYTDPGTVRAITVADGSLYWEHQVGVMPGPIREVQTSDGDVVVAVACEGVFGSGTSTVHLLRRAEGIQATVVDVGDTGNSLTASGDTLWVVSNGSHAVHAIDLLTGEVLTTINTRTSGYNGPRECVIAPWQGRPHLFVTTYTDDVRVFDITTGDSVATLDPQARPDALWWDGGSRLYVGRRLAAGTYDADSGLSVFELLPTSVATSAAPRPSVEVWPLPAATTVHARGFAAGDVRVLAPDGRTMAAGLTPVDAEGTLRLDVRTWTPGVYAITDGRHHGRIMIVR